MLDTSFERIPGDVGNRASYPFDTQIRTIPNADPTKVVADAAPDASLTDAFIEQAQQLQSDGAIGIITSCGFLIHVQKELARAVPVPVMTSALTLAPSVMTSITPRRVGVITASSAALGANSLRAAGLPPDTVVQGLQDIPAFADVYLAAKGKERTPIDYDAIATGVLQATDALMAADPQIGTIILECANLPTYRTMISQRAGAIPVVDILHCAHLLWSAASMR